MANQEDFSELVDNTGNKALERLAKKEGPAWASIITKRIEDYSGGAIDGTNPQTKKELIVKAVEEVLSKEAPAGELPEFVTNSRVRHSRTRAHKPKHASWAFCGWGWAEAVRQGDAYVWFPSARLA